MYITVGSKDIKCTNHTIIGNDKLMVWFSLDSHIPVVFKGVGNLVRVDDYKYNVEKVHWLPTVNELKVYLKRTM